MTPARLGRVAGLAAAVLATGVIHAQSVPGGDGSVPPLPGEATPDDPTTGALRLGVYSDSDQTRVIRSLAEATASWGGWTLSGSGSVDMVSSASIDVRSSPQLSRVDVVTSASSTSTTGGSMSDRRLQLTAAGGWHDGRGHTASLSGAFAAERDYASVSAGLKGSVDVAGRTVTLLGGLNMTRNWIGSVLDRTFARTSLDLGWSVGVARVLTPNDALRLRYDGNATEGYQASPYRNVRFGDWTTSPGENHQIIFMNTIGSADGLPETEPESRVRHAAVAEWLHALDDTVALHTSLRLGRDSWSIDSLTASLDLRVAPTGWRLQLGYRFYMQSAADFYRAKYTLDPSMYAYYTSDKELGRELGHLVNLDVSTVLKQPDGPGDSRVLLDGRVVGLYYSYPDFLLLGSRVSLFFEMGLTWEM